LSASFVVWSSTISAQDSQGTFKIAPQGGVYEPR